MWNRPTHKPKSLQARIVSASFILLSGSGLATAINLVYNIAVARFLGPKGYGDATAVYTLLILLSAVTLSFQIISAKMVAQQKTSEGKHAAYRGFHIGAWGCGIFLGLVLILFQRTISASLHLPGSFLVVLLAAGVAFYIPLGSRRGYLQGAFGFRSLAKSLVLEGAVRLGGSLLLILLGFGVGGVVAANSGAVAVAYFAIEPKSPAWIASPLRLRQVLHEILLALVFFSGQALINNCDIVLVKHFFLSREAGLYAAVAMVGRVIYSMSQAVVNSMFPLVASTGEQERKDLKVIATALMLVSVIGCSMALILRVLPAEVWTALFGAQFEIAGKYGLPYLLALYAITTVVYSLSAVIITYEMSYKIVNTSWVQLAFSGVVIAGICIFHNSLRQVILVQLVLMAVLLILVALPFLVNSVADSDKTLYSTVFRPIRTIRRVSEDEVIADFLKSDFPNPAFRDYWETLRPIVFGPNLDDPEENAKRRALFFIRHLALWSELPAGTEWYEMEVKESDIGQIRAFPRAQWRRIAEGNFSIEEIVEGMRRGENVIDSQLQAKIYSIRDVLLAGGGDVGSVVLIGVGDSDPFTVLDGNHRLVAALLSSPDRMGKLRFFGGLSPRMAECCWYKTNFTTLFRYGRNMLKQMVRSPKAELARLLQVPEG